ncbi:MAG: M67 family metallopeptidase [Pseudomonadota bacterium]|nr:M67 family metallopeptidase [Pseudomonadota bacterium]
MSEWLEVASSEGIDPALRLPPALKELLEALVRAGYPEETCGLLLGRQAEGTVEVLDLKQARNLNRERARDRYELDPADFLAADQAARDRGHQIVGIWHSHPDHPARPSANDRARAWAGWSYLIVSVTPDGVRELRSWRLNDGDFIEEVLE